MKAHIPVAAGQQSATEHPPLNPFYWRIVCRATHPVVAQLCFGIILGLLFLIPHFITSRATIFRDFSWMVGLMITSAALFLYYATYTLIDLIAEADTCISAHFTNSYIKPMQFWLSDGKFTLVGVIFGLLNCIMGYSFGVRYTGLPSKLTIFFGFFVVGFVSGMAAYGLLGVFAFVRGFVQAEPPLDYRNPDRCGGTSFVGRALVKFSALNLVMGTMISIYIVFAPWTNRAHIVVRILMWTWIGFPFFISLAHLLGPGAVIHLMLQRYKKQMQGILAAEVRSTRASFQAPNANTKTLREELEYGLKLQSELYQMNTWPFSFTSAMHVAIAFCVETVPACFEILKLFTENAPHKT